MSSKSGFELHINGAVYSGWKAASLSRDIDCIASSFQVELSDTWPGQLGQRVAMPGEPVEVWLDGEKLLTGYIDAVRYRYDAEVRGTVIQGRSKTGDLVDCSAMNSPGQWKGQRLEQIALDLLKPFKIGISVDVDPGERIPSFALQTGETVFEALQRLAHSRAVLLTDDPLGLLRITRYMGGRQLGPLILGQNVLGASVEFDHRDRFSIYTAYGQVSVLKWDDSASSAKPASQQKAKAVDPDVRRHRPMLTVKEDGWSLKDQVLKEADMRAAHSVQAKATVQGWRDPRGRLWDVNAECAYVDEFVGIDALMVIKGVEFSISDQGSKTELQLAAPQRYSMKPVEETGKHLGKQPFFTEPRRARRR